MKERIIAKLMELEKEHSITVLYACEAGSRAWGLHSKASDYDVRFLYIHPPSFYLSIDPVGIGKKKDTIELPIDQSLDLQGFELTKALRLFRKSNPNFLEWLHSNVVYDKKMQTIDKILDLLPMVFQVKPCVHHYFNMAKRNFYIIEEKNNNDIKQCLQVIRPILICKWMLAYQTFPPMDMATLIKEMTVPGEDRQAIQLLVDAKKNQRDFPVHHLHIYMKRELDVLEHSIPSQSNNPSARITEKLDKLFQETLEEAWH